MWEELGISSGTAVIVLIVLYFIIKWAVKNGVKDLRILTKNGVKEAYRDISRKEKAGLDSGEEESGFQERSVQNES